MFINNNLCLSIRRQVCNFNPISGNEFKLVEVIRPASCHVTKLAQTLKSLMSHPVFSYFAISKPDQVLQD
jgi:hypothetical protein